MRVCVRERVPDGTRSSFVRSFVCTYLSQLVGFETRLEIFSHTFPFPQVAQSNTRRQNIYERERESESEQRINRISRAPTSSSIVLTFLRFLWSRHG